MIANSFDLLHFPLANSGTYTDMVIMKEKHLKLSKDEVDGWVLWARLSKVSEMWKNCDHDSLAPNLG